jgi:glycosyltransferase involved in cell wall biosynthesis
VYLAREIKGRGIVHLHAHFALNASTIAMVVARLTGIPFSFAAHANDLFVNPILLPEKIKAARFIVAISEYNRAFMHNLVPTFETLHKIHVVHCGIDVDRFSSRVKNSDRIKDSATLCPANGHSECGHPASPIPMGPRALSAKESPANASGLHRLYPQGQATIVAVGRLVEKKGYPTLIQACRILADGGYRFRCLIAGSGPQETLLRQLIDDHQLSEHVQLLGRIFQEDLLDLLAQADVFCLPCVVAEDGDMDGIPNTLMEAMAMQIATVSTTVSGIPELIEDGKTGLLAPPRDAASLADAIARLIRDKELRSSLGRAARARIVDQFEIKSNVRRLAKLFGSFS